MNRLVTIVFLLGTFTSAVCGATYYVDFAAGADENDGQSPQKALKHCPGDPGATGNAKNLALQPGDKVIFKGGVTYAGAVEVRSSGAEDNPVVFDGNTEGTFGEGRAIIDGAEPVTGWTRCASAKQAGGNPHWEKIFRAEVPDGYSWRSINLCTERKSLPVAQSPNPSDPFFQENISDFYQTEEKLSYACPAKIYPEKGTHVNSRRPLIQVITPGRGSAVVSPVAGSAFTVELEEPVTVTAVGIFMQPGYTPVKEVAFYGDGEELRRASLEKDAAEVQKFDLAAPATFRKLTVKLLSTFGKVKHDWTAIRRVAAYAEDGTNCLEFTPRMSLKDPKVFTHPDPDYYAGMTLAVHAGHNAVCYLGIVEYRPREHRVFTEFFGDKRYDETRYSLLNSVRLIDRPGEYALEAREDGKPSVLYLWPEDMADAVPAGVGCAKRSHGFSLQGAEHVVVQGFHVRRQGLRRASGIDARGGRDVLVRDCEVSLVKGGTAIGSYRVDGMRVEKCHVHHNPGHTKGIVLRESKNCDVRGCRLVKNTSTGLDYYGCEGGTVADNVVTDHRGMHANGLTFYLGCKDIVIERNRVSRGNVALTFQSAENLLIRNNIFDGNGKTTVVGIWPGQPIRNIRILNNCMVRSNHDVSWQAGLFTNSKKFDGLTVVNNIIDGLCGTPPFPEDAVFSHNLYTRLGPDREDKDFAEGELYEPDAAKVFVDPANGDFRLRPGSPAIDAGAPVERERDVEGTPVPQGGAPDIGPYEYAPGSG